jgi:branched-chain amino acid transport system ATP-binding protein
MSTADALLSTDQLSVSFGGVHAVRQLSVQVRAGQLVGLIGPNGAGKTTFVDALTGFVRSSGTVLFDGTDISAWPVHRRAKAGMLRTWQSTEIFGDLTIEENLLSGIEHRGIAQVFADLVMPGRKRAMSDVARHLDRFGLTEFAKRMPSELSYGQRKLVGVARALAAEPKVLLVDEPAAGLDSRESEELGERLRAVVDEGTAVLLIDHDMGLVLSVCDYIYVIDSGALIAEGTPTDIRNDPRVIAAYLGESADSPQGSVPA